MTRRPAFLALAGLIAASAVPVSARAAAAPERFPLGVSGQSGAVCEAVRNDDDPAAQMRGARAWDVRCRGWDAALGHLYVYGYKGAQAMSPKGLWASALSSRAQCEAPVAAAVPGVVGARRESCKAFAAKVAYVAYSGTARGSGVAAEGFANLADVLETGLRVVAGAARPPKATETLAASAGGQGGAEGGLSAATEAAAAAPENLRERGYNRNLAWRFADAETDFAALAQNAAAPTSIRAEAYLNWALNTSNLGRFTRADALFAQAKALSGGDAALRGEYLSYQALHLRNQKQFKEAIDAAQEARRIFASLQPLSDRGERPQMVKDAGGAMVIGPQLASALRSRTAFATSTLDPGARTRVQIAQTYLTEATAKEATGDPSVARADLERARTILADPSLARIAVWLRVQVEAELARGEQTAGRAAEARVRLAQALVQLRQRQAGSPAEAYLVMELARAESVAGDQAAALRDFAQAIALFKATRGSLGASADSSDAYFNLLLTRIEQDPAHAEDYADRFLAAAESLGSEATADTIARLSARLNQSDSASAGLIRALEDTRRQVRLKEGEIAQLQAQNAYTPALRSVDESALKTLSEQAQALEQKVAAADPRYGQLVTTEVSLKALQAKLKPGELFVKVVLLDQGGYGVAIGPDGAKAYRIPLGQADAGAAVTALRKPFETEGHLPRYDVAASFKLFDALFGPVRERVLKADHIIYEPDPGILAMPIAALATDQKSVDLIAQRRAAIVAKGEGVLSYDGVDWLGKTARTSLVVSAASFVQARDVPASPAKQAFLGFGDSLQARADDPHAFVTVVNRGGLDSSLVDDEICRATRQALLTLKPLKEATQELTTVGATLGAGPSSVVTGAAFSDGLITQRTDLDQYRVLYFATHGLLPQPGGCLPEPALLTSVDDAAAGSDGLLSASKILGLKLDADLVVLSACDTGGGVKGELDRTGLGGAGEALGGLTRAFIYAGARSLIVSHWQIDSEATVRLMTAMFQAKTPSLSGALRQAAASLMASPDQYSHPYYWAAFTVVGDGARPMPGAQLATAASSPASPPAAGRPAS